MVTTHEDGDMYAHKVKTQCDLLPTASFHFPGHDGWSTWGAVETGEQ